MKPTVVILILLLPLILSGESKIRSKENPLIGTWVLDVAKTKENRENLKELPTGMGIMPKAEDVRFRMLTFSEDTLYSGPTASEYKTAYSIIKKKGSSVLVQYSDSDGEPTIYCWWDFPSPDTAINYVSVFDQDSPTLGSKEVASYYKKKPNPEALAWYYTLAVQKHSKHFSFSLMKDGWLAFDTWSDEEAMEENRIEISADEFMRLKEQFESLFRRLENSKEKGSDSQPSFIFERVADTTTTLDFSGHHPVVVEFLNELSRIHKMQLPFSLVATGRIKIEIREGKYWHDGELVSDWRSRVIYMGQPYLWQSQNLP